MGMVFYTDNLRGRTSYDGISPLTQRDEWTKTMNFIYSVSSAHQMIKQNQTLTPGRQHHRHRAEQ